MHTVTPRRLWRVLPWAAALILLFWTAAAAFAQQQPQEEVDPPGRVATLSWRHGSVVFAPEGEDEWVELPQNRPLTSGDRLWSDNGARAEVHLGSATLHVDGESHVGISALDDRAAQFILMQGTVNARVRELAQGENFEIGTPNLAFRANQPGDYRIDVDADGRETRVVVLSGMATVYGEGGQAINLGAGQQATFAGRFLAQVHGTPYQGDEFAQWAGERNRAEDLSMAARHVPRGVVGYQQLDQHGTWGQDPTHGAVWYPRVVVNDWAPYRYGRWEWVSPWGWTWIDDAPWGFAPFHYGRWAQIGSRWAWVPGRMVARPVYSPALVVFLGGGGLRLAVGSGPGVGWYPLGPGEAWYPWYRTSPRYVSFANFNINLGAYPRHYDNHRHRHWATAVREEDFRHGRNVRNHWQRVQPAFVGQAQVGSVPARPERQFQREATVAARLQSAPRVSVQPALPSRFWGQGREGWDRTRQQREWADRNDRFERNDRNDRFDGRREQQAVPQQQPRFVPQHQVAPQQAMPQPRFVPQPHAVREQAQAQREQQRLQWEAERNSREQQRQQHEQAARRVQEQQARAQQEALRQQQEAVRQQQEAMRQQQEAQRHQRLEAAQQERAMRQRAQEPRAGMQQPAPQVAAPIGRTAERGEGRGRGGERDGRWQRDDDGPGRGGRGGERDGRWQR